MAAEWDDEVRQQARGQIRSRRAEEALRTLAPFVEGDRPHPEAVELQAMAYCLNNEPEAARDAYQLLTRLQPRRAEAWVNLGAMHNRLGDYRKAAEVLRRALQKDRRCVQAYYNLGIAQKNLNQNTMAISAYKEALKLDPEMPDAHQNLGNLYLAMHNHRMALRHFEKVLELKPESQKAKNLIRHVEQLRKKAEDSISPFGRLVDEEELAKKAGIGSARKIAPAIRDKERELTAKLGRAMRHSVREAIPLLEANIQNDLRTLHRHVSGDQRTADDVACHEDLAASIKQFEALMQHVHEGAEKLRRHFRDTPTLGD